MSDNWPPRHSPRTHFEDNPLFSYSAKDDEDWRDGLEYDDFVRFARWCQENITCERSESVKKGGKKKKRGGGGNVQYVPLGSGLSLCSSPVHLHQQGKGEDALT